MKNWKNTLLGNIVVGANGASQQIVFFNIVFTSKSQYVLYRCSLNHYA